MDFSQKIPLGIIPIAVIMSFVAQAANVFWVGIWLFASLLGLGITGLSRFKVLGPSLFFVLFTLTYLWKRRDLSALG